MISMTINIRRYAVRAQITSVTIQRTPKSRAFQGAVPDVREGVSYRTTAPPNGRATGPGLKSNMQFHANCRWGVADEDCPTRRA